MCEAVPKYVSEEYESEITASSEDVAAILSGIVDGITTGSFQVGDEDEAIVLDIPEELTLEIEVETEADEVSLELEMEWSQPTTEVDSSTSGTSEEGVDETGPPVEDTDTAISVGAADGSASLARFEVFRDRAEEWRWRLRHRNGNIIATSGEGYTRKHNAQKGLQSVVQNAPDADITAESSLD